MSLEHTDILSRLSEPFDKRFIEWRIGTVTETRNGLRVTALAYVTSRAIQARLDEVVGMMNWQSSFAVSAEGAICRLSIRLDGEWVTKEDGANPTKIEGYKGMLSSAFKRAAVMWGIGRYLYDLPETVVETSEEKKPGWEYATYYRKNGQKAFFYWKVPELPKWALPPYSTAMDLEDVQKTMKEKLKTPENWRVFLQKIRNKYRTNDVQYILTAYGKEIIEGDWI